MESNTEFAIIDARTDERWVRNVETLVHSEDWSELWKLAQKAPPIWTVRILRQLHKKSWLPCDDEQLPFFQELSGFVSGCNEYDLPGPDLRAAITMQIDTPTRRIAAARITADGEFVFVLDDRAAAIEVWRLSDLGIVERIRLDMIAGKQYATLAFAINPAGDRLAVLSYEVKFQQPFIHLYELADGEVVANKWLKVALSNLGKQGSRMAFDNSGEKLAIYSTQDLITIFDSSSGEQLRQYENPPPPYTELDDFPTCIVDHRSNQADWAKYGRRTIVDSFSRSLAFAWHDDLILAWQCRQTVMSSVSDGTYFHSAISPLGNFCVSNNGRFVAALEQIAVYLTDLTNVRDEQICYCRDPLAMLAISEDSELLAVAMPHSEVINILHIPDGRPLGSLPGLAREALADFRFTTGGSVVSVTRSGLVQIWEADGNGNAWPWSRELVQITHQPVDSSSVEILRRAQEMRRRGWLSLQESKLLDLALALMQNRLNLDIEIEWEGQLPGDIYDIEID